MRRGILRRDEREQAVRYGPSGVVVLRGGLLALGGFSDEVHDVRDAFGCTGFRHGLRFGRVAVTRRSLTGDGPPDIGDGYLPRDFYKSLHL